MKTDCATAVQMLMAPGNESSAMVHIVRRIKESLGERDISVTKINRSQKKKASHCLANMGRVLNRTQFWISDYPANLQDVICKDCNSYIT
jgi:hypothetical protein